MYTVSVRIIPPAWAAARPIPDSNPRYCVNN